MHGEGFNITVGEFKGSLEALLSVVQKRKLHISDVSLASVADEYVEYVQSLGKLPQEQTAEFIVVAATLLLIKSKSLLPNLSLSMEEEESIQDLEYRLGLYKLYQHARDALIEHIDSTQVLYGPRKALSREQVRFAPPSDAKSLTVQALHQALGGVLTQLPKVEIKDSAELTEAIDIKDVMHSLLQRVEQSMQSFTELAGEGRQEVLVNFLALLELVKDGVMLAEQSSEHGEIMIKSTNEVI